MTGGEEGLAGKGGKRGGVRGRSVQCGGQGPRGALGHFSASTFVFTHLQSAAGCFLVLS